MSEQEATDIDGMVKALFEHFGDAETDDAVHAVLIAQAEQIRVIAKACESTGLFAHSAGKFEKFKADLDSSTEPEKRLVEAWKWLLNRIVEAPTRFHMIGAVRLCLPLVARYLPNEAA